MADITMPQLGETVTEGMVTKWFKKVGDTVAVDEVLFEVSTDKVDSEVTSIAAGVLTEIRVAEGDTVDVGTVLAVIGDGAAAPVAAPAPAPAVAAPAPAVPPVVAAPVVAAPVVAAPVVVAPVNVPPPAEPSVVQAPVPPAGANVDAIAAAAAGLEGMEKVLSPVVRKLINENDLDPTLLTGTGVGGRITREDVLTAIDAGTARRTVPSTATASTPPPDAPVAPVAPVMVPPAVPVAAAPAAPAPAPVVAPPAPAPVASAPIAVASAPAPRLGARDELVPLNNIRRRTGEHMVMSLQTAPHAFIAVEVDYSNVDRIRAAKKDGFKADEGFSLTYMPFIARAVVESARKYPNVNASVAGDSLVVHHSVHLGVAVDLDFQGLMVPVVRDADGKRMRAIARDISDLAGRARTKKLTPDDISGGTFTLSNAGPYGIDLMQSVINQPQVGILSITSVSKKPVVVTLPDGSDTIAIRPMGMLGLSWDHRAFDGAYAASFLADVKAQLQDRDWSTEL